ncbi:MAG: hypothetical protein PHH01_01425 [Patescibacteria group bacterium]|nr:hypothetical protein [Patescibacteria group bacterium]
MPLSTCPETQSTMRLEGQNIIELKLGPERNSRDSALAELLWFRGELSKLNEQFPNAFWSALVDMNKVSVSQKEALALNELFPDLLKSDRILRTAVLKAGHTFQVAIRKLLLATTKETGKLKFFEQSEMAREWLYLKMKK